MGDNSFEITVNFWFKIDELNDSYFAMFLF
jgi:hypothetical protein